MPSLEELVVRSSENQIKPYIVFSNADGKKWALPHEELKTQLCIYQPSSIKGKMLKKILPLMKGNSLFLKALRAENASFEICSELVSAIEESFGESELSFGLFFGTPGVHQKIVIQINKKSQILGYCKVTDSDAVFSNFQKEFVLLKKLKKKGINNTPIALCVKRILDDSVGIFIQTTTKTSKSKVVHELNDAHISFITDMCKKTASHIKYEESRIFKDIQFLEGCEFARENRAILKGVNWINSVLEKQENIYSVCHGDFTPWNTYFEGNHLFVFDWEYAEESYPPMIDLIHFFNQSCFFEKSMKADEIVQKFDVFKKKTLNLAAEWTGYDSDFLYVLYLLSMISLVIQRETNLLPSSEKNVELWSNLIGLMIERKK